MADTVALLAMIGVMLHGYVSGLVSPGVVADYCEDETFRAKCEADEIVVMESARYGRMSRGRCFPIDVGGAKGCFADVMAEFDAWCSGRRSCDILVRDLLVVRKRPCPTGLSKYLAAEYKCLHVTMPAEDICRTSPPTPIVTPSGYIASAVTEATLCGTVDNPWTIRALPGQLINVTIVTFNLQRLQTGQSTPICQVLSVIKETSGLNTKTVCRESPKQRHVYLSATNEIEVRIVTSTLAPEKEKVHFLLHYEAIGCPDIDNSRDSWFRRTIEGATYGCLSDGKEWQLRCVGQEWIGQRGTCESALNDPAFNTKTKEGMSPGLSIIVVVAIATAIGILILLLGITCLRRKRRPETLGDRTIGVHQPPRRVKNTDAHQCQAQQRPLPDLATSAPGGVDRADFENNYFRTWELPRHLTTGVEYCRASSDSMPYTTPEEWGLEERYAEHVYDSPQSVRRHPVFQGNTSESTQYFELDPSVEVATMAHR